MDKKDSAQNPHDTVRHLFKMDVDEIASYLYRDLRNRDWVGTVAKTVEGDPSFTLGVEYGILAALDKLIVDRSSAAKMWALLGRRLFPGAGWSKAFRDLRKAADDVAMITSGWEAMLTEDEEDA